MLARELVRVLFLLLLLLPLLLCAHIKLFCIQGTIASALKLPFPINVSIPTSTYSSAEELLADVKTVCQIPPFVPASLHLGPPRDNAKPLRTLELQDGSILHMKLGGSNRTIAEAMLQAFKSLFVQYDIPFFLEGGELLGGVREGRLIAANFARGKMPMNGKMIDAYERDIDIGAYYEHKHKLQSPPFRDAVKGMMCEVLPAGDHKTRILTYQGLGSWIFHIDIWWFEARGNVRVQDPATGVYQLPAVMLKPPLKSVQIGRERYDIPHNASFLLSLLYGPDWRKPSDTKPSFTRLVSNTSGQWAILDEVWAHVIDDPYR